MGRERLKDKAIKVLQAAINPAQAIAAKQGFYPIGVYKGQLAFLDLDKQNNQPLVLAEKAYALDRLDDRDAVDVTLGAGAAVGSTGRDRQEVPAGEVWFINRVVLNAPAADGGGASLDVNFRVSIWPDTAATPDTDGKAYFGTDKAPLGVDEVLDLPAQGELGEELRLPGGSKITLVATVVGAALAADTTATMTLYGRKGKALVE